MKLKTLLNVGAFGDTEITDITNDSRKVREGYAFVCIEGSAHDGHRYAADALEKGAAVIICRKDLGLDRQIIVADTRAAYAEMCAARFGRPADRLRLIGITGTNGKTTVAYMLKAILEAAGHKVGLVGTIKNMIGDRELPAKNTTPDPYELNCLFAQMVESGCDTAVMEVSSHALDQKRVYGLRFAMALFTNLTQDHLDYHKTMQNYMEAKKSLFKAADLAVMNYDDPWYPQLSEGLKCPVVTYSLSDDNADYSAKSVDLSLKGAVFDFVGYSLIGRVRLKMPGKFSVYNAMCAAAAAVKAGVGINTICSALSDMPGVPGRAETVPTGRDFSVVIDYAHTPDGLEKILTALKECRPAKLTVLFGCGGDRDKTKRPIMAKVCAALADFLIITSDNPRGEDPQAIIDDITAGLKDTKTAYVTVPDRTDAINYAVSHAVPGEIVLLAGKGHENYQIFSDRTIAFDEREKVRLALEKLPARV